MRLQAEPRGLVIGHHFLAQRHGGQLRPRSLGALVAGCGGGKQWQVRPAHDAARIPQRLPARQLHRTEAVPAGQAFDMRRADPRAVLERGDIGIGPARFTLGDQPCRHGLWQAVDLPQAET